MDNVHPEMRPYLVGWLSAMQSARAPEARCSICSSDCGRREFGGDCKSCEGTCLHLCDACLERHGKCVSCGDRFCDDSAMQATPDGQKCTVCIAAEADEAAGGRWAA